MTAEPESTATPTVTVVDPEGRTVTYLRVSGKRQMDTAVDIDPDGNSIATQRQYARAKAAKLGSSVRIEFIEPGNSAQTIEKRPVFRQLLQFIKEHPGEIDYVIIYMRSRAFRNYIDAGVTERQLGSLSVKLISAKEDFGDGIWGDAMKAVADIMNEVQVRMSGEDIRSKLEHKARSGGTISRARLGYKNVRVEFDGRLVNTIAIDDERAPLIHQAFELYASGDLSIDRLADAMSDLGLRTRATARWPSKPVSDSKLHAMLKDPYYLGHVVYKGELMPGRHEAIISQSLFDQVQDVLDARSARGQRDRVLKHYLKGMLYCDRCHRAGRLSRLIYTEARGRSRHYGYFFCRSRHDGLCDLPHLPVAQVERAVEDHYETLSLDPTYIETMLIELDKTMADHQASTSFLHETLRKQLDKLATQEDRLVDLAADGALPQTRIRSKLNTIALDRKRIEEGLARTDKELSVGADLLRSALELSRRPADLYDRATDRTRRAVNETFFDCFFIDDRGSVALAPLRSPFDDLSAAEQAYLSRKAMGATERAHEGRDAAVAQLRPTVRRSETWTGLRRLTDVDLVSGSNKTVLVVLRGQLLNPAPTLVTAMRSYRKLDLHAHAAPRTRLLPAIRTLKRLSLVEIDQLVANYESGATIRQLAKQFGIGRVSVSNHLHDRGVQLRLRSLTPAELRLAIQLYQQGRSLAQVGERFGRDPSQIRLALIRAGIPRRDAHGRERR